MPPYFGSSYARSEYPQLIRDEILEKYKGKKKNPKEIEKEIALETYAVRAAMFLIDGPEKGMKFVQEPKKKDPKAKKKDDDEIIRIDDILGEDFRENDDLNAVNDMLDNERFLVYDQVKTVSEQLKKRGILQYAEDNYGYLLNGGLKNENGDPVTIVPQEEMKVEGFLLANMDKLNTPEEDVGFMEMRKTELREELNQRSMTWREYWDFKCPDRRKQQAGAPLREKNESVYEYEADFDDWKLFSSLSHALKGDGGRLMEREEIDRIMSLPIPKMMLRNKQTVEKMKRGDLAGVTEDYQKTLNSFTFRDKDELKLMQEQADKLEEEMRQMNMRATNSQEWRDLRYALINFSKADSKDAAKRSAEVLMAVEKFTKGRKSEQDAETQACVDKALKGLSICVPDARNNPSVKPLVNRFNQVRGWHLFQKGIELQDYGTASALSPEKKNLINNIKEEELDPLNTAVDKGHKNQNKDLRGNLFA